MLSYREIIDTKYEAAEALERFWRFRFSTYFIATSVSFWPEILGSGFQCLGYGFFDACGAVFPETSERHRGI